MFYVHRRALGAAVLVSLVAIAACSGGGNDATDTTTNPPIPVTAVPTTEDVPTTTTTGDTVATTTTLPNTMPLPGEPVMPLTGGPIIDEAVAARPALAVKIDNHPRSRPQAGLNQADIVFEENVEQLTRFAAVFHSEVANPVGPVRSGRSQDVELLGSFNRPLFAWSGGNPGVTAVVRASDLRDVGALTNFSGGGYFRTSDRSSPHNLYAQGSMLMSLAPADAGPPPVQFAYRDEGEAVRGGEGADGVRISMDGVRVQWDWIEEFSLYQRRQGDAPHLLADGSQVDARNVVVMFVEYHPSRADRRSPEAQTVGTGAVWVHTGGSLVTGTWSRESLHHPIALTALDGTHIELAPGRTWVELSRWFRAVTVPTGVDPAAVAFP